MRKTRTDVEIARFLIKAIIFEEVFINLFSQDRKMFFFRTVQFFNLIILTLCSIQ